MITDYQAKYIAHDLTRRRSSDSAERLAVAVAGAQVDVTYTAGQTTLYYNGEIVAQLTTQANGATSLFCGLNGQTYSAASTGELKAGASYTPIAGQALTFGTSTSWSVAGGGGNGSFQLSEGGSYSAYWYHSQVFPQGLTQNYGSGGGGGGNKYQVQPNCVASGILALGASLGLALAIMAAIANPVFGLLEVAALVAGHGFAVASIVDAFAECGGGF